MSKQNKCKCSLCSIKKKVWVENGFYQVNCKKHYVPLISTVEHKTKLTLEEEQILNDLIKKYHPRKYIVSIPCSEEDHWHVHISRCKEKL